MKNNKKARLVKAMEEAIRLQSLEDAERIMGRFAVAGKPVDYEYDEKFSCFRVEIKLHCKLDSTHMIMIFDDDGITFKFPIRIKTDSDNIIQTMEFIIRANYGLNIGCFQMDIDNNYIEYKIYDTSLHTSLPYMIYAEKGLVSATSDLLQTCTDFGARMLERYGDELLAVMFGTKSVDDAIEAAERKVL